MKQCKIYDRENNCTFGGLLFDDGRVLCASCGVIFEPDDNFEVVAVYDQWIDFSETIIS